MAKIVYNACYGGFGLSEPAVRRYCELKGIGFFPDSKSIFTTFWTVPEAERTGILDSEEFRAASIEQRQASNARYRELTVDCGRIPRHDAALVQVVEELGDAANGFCAKLRIEDLPDGSLYRIDEYDGNESVMTNGDYEWTVAA
jgi:hypothetical protein